MGNNSSAATTPSYQRLPYCLRMRTVRNVPYLGKVPLVIIKYIGTCTEVCLGCYRGGLPKVGLGLSLGLWNKVPDRLSLLLTGEARLPYAVFPIVPLDELSISSASF